MSFSYVVQPIYIFALMGQSNMAGGGVVPENPYTHPDIISFGNDYLWHEPAMEPIDSAINQVDLVSLDNPLEKNHFGMGMAFAARLRRLQGNGYKIVLVPCARGGSTMEQWQPAKGRDTLYGSLLNRIREALKRPNTVMGGALFFQGESEADSETCEDANKWDKSFRRVFTTLRNDLGDKHIPVVFFQLGAEPQPIGTARPCWNEVKDAQARVNMWKVAMVDTMGVPRKNEYDVHYLTAGYNALGRLGAEAMYSIMTGQRK